jgi:limonene 1,2-monooxygenase
MALERDVALIQLLESLGFEEAWFGEHHSGGWELISSPEVFIAHVAARTTRIRLGTGVVSLPYHHPFTLTQRMVLLDHVTRGRAMLGVGPGQLASDAYMLGIDAGDTRRMMEESLEAIIALLESEEPISRSTDWFTMRDAHLQMRPFTSPRMEVCVAASYSPAGPAAAGRFGAGLISVAATQKTGFDALAFHWGILTEVAEANGRAVDRSAWRLMGPMHLADSVNEAKRDLRHGYDQVYRYLRHGIPLPPESGSSLEERVDQANESQAGCFGTPDMAIEHIQRLIDQSGGFGCYLFLGADFADPAATRRSYELFAREVMPHFQSQLDAQRRSEQWIIDSKGVFVESMATAVRKATESYIKPGT